MTRRRRRLFARLGVGAVLLARRHGRRRRRGPFPALVRDEGPVPVASEAATACGIVGHTAEHVLAHTRWRSSPVERLRPPHVHARAKIRGTPAPGRPCSGSAGTTKNTALEGERGVHPLDAVVLPLRDEGGATSRHTVIFEWFRDRSRAATSTAPQARADLRALHRRAARRPTTKGPPLGDPFKKNRRRPTLPGGCPPSTIGAGGLNFSVRNGKRCFPAAMTTGNCESCATRSPRTLKTP